MIILLCILAVLALLYVGMVVGVNLPQDEDDIPSSLRIDWEEYDKDSEP